MEGEFRAGLTNNSCFSTTCCRPRTAYFALQYDFDKNNNEIIVIIVRLLNEPH